MDQLCTYNNNIGRFTQWLLSHPKFIGNPFYVAGDSYTGIIAPIIAHKISTGKFVLVPFHFHNSCLLKQITMLILIDATGIELGHKPPINLKVK